MISLLPPPPTSIPPPQVQQLEAKRQLEVQQAQHQRTREQLTAAQLELSTLRMQQNSRESLPSPKAQDASAAGTSGG